MGYMSDGLTFNVFRAANRKRLPQFKNAKGEFTHPDENGKDWPLSKWMNAATGELGEAANIIKKIERGDFSLEEGKEKLAKELADIICYIDLLANAADINLGKAVSEKFNEVSERVGSNIYIHEDGTDWYYLNK